MNTEEKDRDGVVKRHFKIKVSHILILLLILCIGAFIHFRVSTNDQIRKRIEAIHAEGYPVTCEELDQWYAIPMNAENAAFLVLDAIYDYIEPNDVKIMPVVGPVELPSRTELMPEDMKMLISQFLSDNQKSLEFLHKTPQLEYSRYPINLSLGMAALVPNLAEIRKCIFLLQLEAVFSAENDNPADAFSSIVSMLGTAGTLSFEPLLISQLVRISCQNKAVSSLEYSVNRIVFTKEQLTELGEAFRKAENSPGMKRAFVGERCAILSAFDAPPSVTSNLIGGGLPPVPLLAVYKALGIMHKEEVIFLDLEKEYLDAFELPTSRQIEAFNIIQAKVEALPKFNVLLHTLMPAYSRVISLNLKNTAQLRSARTALAVQKYRLMNNKLPDSLDNLVPDYVESVPLDPFDGQKIRYKKLEKGFVIYSIGEDKTDNGGKESSKDSKKKNDLDSDITFIIEK